jgi:hypothetical protein
MAGALALIAGNRLIEGGGVVVIIVAVVLFYRENVANPIRQLEGRIVALELEARITALQREAQVATPEEDRIPE